MHPQELLSLVMCNHTHLFLSKKPSLVPLRQLAAGLGVLLDTHGCGTVPQAQDSRNMGHGLAWNLQEIYATQSQANQFLQTARQRNGAIYLLLC